MRRTSSTISSGGARLCSARISSGATAGGPIVKKQGVLLRELGVTAKPPEPHADRTRAHSGPAPGGSQRPGRDRRRVHQGPLSQQQDPCGSAVPGDAELPFATPLRPTPTSAAGTWSPRRAPTGMTTSSGRGVDIRLSDKDSVFGRFTDFKFGPVPSRCGRAGRASVSVLGPPPRLVSGLG